MTTKGAVWRGVWRGVALLVVSIADAGVVAALLDASPVGASAQLAWLLAAHVSCAAVAGVVLARAAPELVASAPRHVALVTSVLAFFVPVLGPLGALAMLRIGLQAPRPTEREPWLILDQHRATPRLHAPAASPAEIRATLRTRTRTPDDDARRFEALLATRQLSARTAVPLLELAQTDPVEEIRLYAFSRLEGMRRALEQQTDEIRAALREASPSSRPRLHLRLAECCWELGYQGLAEGAVLQHALKSAYQNVVTACDLQPGHAPAEFFRGRLLLHLRDAGRARCAFERAMAAGYPRSKVLPYLAECAFHERELVVVAALLRELEATAPGHVFFRPVIELWRARTREPHADAPIPMPMVRVS